MSDRLNTRLPNLFEMQREYVRFCSTYKVRRSRWPLNASPLLRSETKQPQPPAARSQQEIVRHHS